MSRDPVSTGATGINPGPAATAGRPAPELGAGAALEDLGRRRPRGGAVRGPHGAGRTVLGTGAAAARGRETGGRRPR